MSFCLAVFPPSKNMRAYLQEHLEKYGKKADDTVAPVVKKLAALCSDRLPNVIRSGQRREVPSKEELRCLAAGKPMPIEVQKCDGTTLSLVRTATVAIFSLCCFCFCCF